MAAIRGHLVIGLIVPVLAGGGFVGNITLSGTSVSPNLTSKVASPGNTSTWSFKTDGTVEKDGSAFNAGTEWNDLQPNVVRPLFVRATANDTDPAVAISGESLGSWLQLSGTGAGDRIWTFTSDGNVGEASVKIEIARGSDGSGILATGFYGSEYTSV